MGLTPAWQHSTGFGWSFCCRDGLCLGGAKHASLQNLLLRKPPFPGWRGQGAAGLPYAVIVRPEHRPRRLDVALFVNVLPLVVLVLMVLVLVQAALLCGK